MQKSEEIDKTKKKREKRKQFLYLSLTFLLCLVFSVLLITEIILNRFTQDERTKLLIVAIGCILTTVMLGIGTIISLFEKK